jgi:2'-5' RNA ligase
MLAKPPAPEPFTIRNVRRDFVEWHLGRAAYALWALHFDSTALLPRMQAAQAHLAPWLLDGYRRQPHITLSLCGFPSARPSHADDFGPALLHAQVAALQQARPTAFELEIGGLATFSSVPYFTVHAPAGHLQALRACLAPQPAQGAHDDYTPHVTVGLYADAWPMDAVLASLRAFAVPERLRLQVRGISLLSYAATDIGGPLQCLADYDFASATLQWHGVSPFQVPSL